MGREKRASQSRAQEILDKTGRGNGPTAGTTAATPAVSSQYDQPVTSTRKAIVQIILLYMVPILLVILVGKLILKL